jgi:hypothetical protein
MGKVKSTLNFVVVFSSLLGLVFVIGCGGSAEKQEMSEFLKLYSDTVGEYEAADDTKKTQLKEKIESYKLKWSAMTGELHDKFTPQVVNELEREYKKISKRYAALNS